MKVIAHPLITVECLILECYINTYTWSFILESPWLLSLAGGYSDSDSNPRSVEDADIAVWTALLCEN